MRDYDMINNQIIYIGADSYRYKMITTIQGIEVKPNRYLIGEHGQVFNLITGQHMKLELSYSGHKDKVTGKRTKQYYRIRLTLPDGSGKHFLIHRLVAEYFCINDDPVNKTFVDHKDGNKKRNIYTNLEWVTPKENAIRSYAQGTSYTKGEQCHLSVYSDEQVHQMCQLLEQQVPTVEIIRMMNLADTTKGYEDPDRKRATSYIKKLRSGTFRKDIVSQYDVSFKGSTTIER